MSHRLSLLPAALAGLLLAAPPLSAQGGRREKCTVCEHDAELLAENGVKHEPFIFGRTDTEQIEQDLLWRPVWLETAHFRIGAELAEWKVPELERKQYEEILTPLAAKWPRVKPKAKTLDKWLRAHLLAERAEQLYGEFMQLMGIDEQRDFLDPEKNRLRGIGPYLGEKDKYEIMIFEQRGPYRDYMTKTWGLSYIKPQRWNHIERGCMWFGLNQEEDQVRHDQHLHNMVRHNLAHNLLDGYMFYAFDLPVWITEGFAHWVERSNDPRFNMFDTVEGSFHEGRGLEHWAPEVRKIVVKDEAATFASLLRRASFAEIDWEDHLICWSKIDFLIRTDPQGFGRLITWLKSRRNERGEPDATNMDAAQRDGFEQFLNLNVQQAEAEWKAWVLATYPQK